MRPLLNFRLRRVHFRMFTQVHFLGSYAREDDCPPWVCKQPAPVGMATIYTSGGYSGEDSNNDFIQTMTGPCLPLTDPSFLPLLAKKV